MPRSDAEVVAKLLELYREEFGGKQRQRFLISWADLRSLYGLSKLYVSRFENLKQLASEDGLYLWDLGEGEKGHYVAVIKFRTVDRWRKVPKTVMVDYRASSIDSSEEDTDDDD